MSDVSVIAPVGASIDTVKRVLFKPFNVTKWFGMAFTAWLAMLAENFTGFMANGFNSGGQDFFKVAWRWFESNAILSSVTFAVLLLLACSLVLIVSWVSARGRFMFLDNVVNNRSEVIIPWGRWGRQGNSYFLFSIAFAAVLLGAAFIIGGLVSVPLVWGSAQGALLIAVVAFGAITSALCLVAVGCVYVFLDDFVVPIMACRACGVIAAWNAFRKLFMGNPGVFVLYLLFRSVLAVAVGLAAMLIFCATCCLAFVPFLGTVVMLPLLVFMRSYPVHFLEQFGEPFRLFALPPAECEAAAELNQSVQEENICQ